MSHIIISSDEVSSGFTYDGIFTFPKAVGGTLVVSSHFVGAGEIPWAYTGCNNILIQPTGDQVNAEIVDLDLISSSDPAVVAPRIVSAFNNTFLTSGTTCVFDPLLNQYDCTVTAAIDLRWTNAQSNAKFSLGKRNAADENNVQAFSFSGRDIDDRPKYLEVFFVESTTVNKAAKNDPGDLVISTFDEEVRGAALILPGLFTQLQISFRRTNVPKFSVPFLMKWDLLFTGQ